MRRPPSLARTACVLALLHGVLFSLPVGAQPAMAPPPYATVEVPARPYALFVLPGTHRALLVSKASPELGVLDLAARTVDARADLADTPADAALAPDGTALFVATNRGSGGSVRGEVLALEVDNGQVVRRYDPLQASAFDSVMASPYRFLLPSRDGTRLFTFGSVNWIHGYETATGRLVAYANLCARQVGCSDRCARTKTCTLDVNPQSAVLSPDETVLYLSVAELRRMEGGGLLVLLDVYRVDVATGAVSALDLGPYRLHQPERLGATPDGRLLFANVLERATAAPGVVVLDGATGSLLRFLPGATFVGPPFFSHDGARGYLPGADGLRVLDLATLEVRQTLSLRATAGIETKDGARLYTFASGTAWEHTSRTGPPDWPDLSVYERATGQQETVYLASFLRDALQRRVLAATDDDRYVVVTNDQYDTVTIVENSAATAREDEAPRPALAVDAFPNPATGPVRFRVVLPGAGSVSLQLYDVLGREVAAAPDAFGPAGALEPELSVEGLATGLYFYRLRWDGREATGRLVVRR